VFRPLRPHQYSFGGLKLFPPGGGVASSAIPSLNGVSVDPSSSPFRLALVLFASGPLGLSSFDDKLMYHMGRYGQV
tara:strand:+ start:1047 stop:1274 length:228 start_codon:yes stop_codon:yes gene_type:complete